MINKLVKLNRKFKFQLFKFRISEKILKGFPKVFQKAQKNRRGLRKK